MLDSSRGEKKGQITYPGVHRTKRNAGWLVGRLTAAYWRRPRYPSCPLECTSIWHSSPPFISLALWASLMIIIKASTAFCRILWLLGQVSPGHGHVLMFSHFILFSSKLIDRLNRREQWRGERKIFSFFFCLLRWQKSVHCVKHTHTDIYTLGYRMNGAASFVSYGINKRVRLASDTPVIRRTVVVFFFFESRMRFPLYTQPGQIGWHFGEKGDE